MKNISDRQDGFNKRFIASASWNPIFYSPGRDRLLAEGTPAERAAYVKKVHKRLGFTLLVIIAILWIGLTIPKSPVPPNPEPEITPAGTVKALQLHSTTFTTETTVQTSVGTYQVGGAVSASVGDVASLKRVTKPYGTATFFCVESQIKNACYSLL